jgi:hypothetical protein
VLIASFGAVLRSELLYGTPLSPMTAPFLSLTTRR